MVLLKLLVFVNMMMVVFDITVVKLMLCIAGLSWQPMVITTVVIPFGRGKIREYFRRELGNRIDMYTRPFGIDKVKICKITFE